MSYVDKARKDALLKYKKPYYTLPRRDKLDAEMTCLVTDYFTKSEIGRPFEARGLIVTGESRSGKSREITEIVGEFNTEGNILPNGQPARFVQCSLSSMLTWKDLGIKVLEAMGYPMNASRTQSYIWSQVTQQARLQGVIGIHFDECQHMFTDTAKTTNAKVLDGFKALCKNDAWPFAIILSGVPVLTKFVYGHDQLWLISNKVHLDLIDRQADMKDLNDLCFAYADVGGIKFEPLALRSFYEKLAFSGGYRWGLVIEILIEALVICELDGQPEINIVHFEKAFANKTGIAYGYSPFSMEDYEDAFSEAEIVRLLTRSDP